jgi:hypothetical protein
MFSTMVTGICAGDSVKVMPLWKQAPERHISRKNGVMLLNLYGNDDEESSLKRFG